jgi:T5SS/PEP-CTERM-associated repeat protein
MDATFYRATQITRAADYQFHWIAAMTLAIAWTTATQDATAQVTTWLGGTGSWFDAANWSLLGGVPDQNSGALINNGGTAEILAPGANAESVTLGNNAAHDGTLAVRGGDLQLRVTGGGLMRVGNFGTGELIVLDGGEISGRTGQIATGAMSSGVATVAGFGGTWVNLERIFVGLGGTGTLDILRGGRVETTGTAYATSASIGTDVDANGTVNVDGDESKFINSTGLVVGERGVGALNIADGGAASNIGANIGDQNGSSGTVNVSGIGSSWNATGDMSVGNSGTGMLTIESGGTVTNVNGNIGVNGPSGLYSGGDGAVIVRGAGSQWTNGVVAVGISGRGKLTIEDGAVVTSTNGRIAREVGSSGTVSVSGTNSWWANTGVLTIGLAGTGFARLDVNGGGLVTAAGGITIGPLGSVRGDGTLGTVGGPPVVNGGLVAPGNSPGTMFVQGSFTQIEGGTLEIEIDSTANDKLDVRGVLSLGGTLDVSLLDNYVPRGTQSFDILDWTSGLSGTFSALQLPTLDGILIWDTSQLYTDGVLTVTGPDADFNDDSVLDAADIDLLAWGVHNDPENSRYDLNGDGVVNYAMGPPGTIQSDSDVLIRLLLQTEYGDLNLDRQVFLSDLNTFATHYRQAGQFGWAEGNINGSQEAGTSASPRVFLADLNALATHWRFGVGSGASTGGAIPEPAALIMLIPATAAVLSLRAGRAAQSI